MAIQKTARSIIHQISVGTRDGKHSSPSTRSCGDAESQPCLAHIAYEYRHWYANLREEEQLEPLTVGAVVGDARITVHVRLQLGIGEAHEGALVRDVLSRVSHSHTEARCTYRQIDAANVDVGEDKVDGPPRLAALSEHRIKAPGSQQAACIVYCSPCSAGTFPTLRALLALLDPTQHGYDTRCALAVAERVL